MGEQGISIQYPLDPDYMRRKFQLSAKMPLTSPAFKTSLWLRASTGNDIQLERNEVVFFVHFYSFLLLMTKVPRVLHLW
jgi:hypothetical protein